MYVVCFAPSPPVALSSDCFLGSCALKPNRNFAQHSIIPTLCTFHLEVPLLRENKSIAISHIHAMKLAIRGQCNCTCCWSNVWASAFLPQQLWLMPIDVYPFPVARWYVPQKGSFYCCSGILTNLVCFWFTWCAVRFAGPETQLKLQGISFCCPFDCKSLKDPGFLDWRMNDTCSGGRQDFYFIACIFDFPHIEFFEQRPSAWIWLLCLSVKLQNRSFNSTC